MQFLFHSHMRRMHDTMNSIFGNAFGSNMMFRGGDGPHLGMGPPRSSSSAMMPFQQPHSAVPFPYFAFPNNMNQLMRSVGQNHPNCHSFSSSTVVSMTTGPDGKPQVEFCWIFYKPWLYLFLSSNDLQQNTSSSMKPVFFYL